MTTRLYAILLFLIVHIACYAPCLGAGKNAKDIPADKSHIRASYILPCENSSSSTGCIFSTDGLPSEIAYKINTMESAYLRMEHRHSLVDHLIGFEKSRADYFLGINQTPEYIPHIVPYPDSDEKLIFVSNDESVEYTEKSYFMIDTYYAHFIEYKSRSNHWKMCVPSMIMPASPMIVNDHIVYIGYRSLVVINKKSGDLEEEYELKDTSLETDIPYIKDGLMLIPSATVHGAFKNSVSKDVMVVLEVSL